MNFSAEVLMDQWGGSWGDHPDHSIEDWRYEVANNDTRLGYWEWVAARIDEGNCPKCGGSVVSRSALDQCEEQDCDWWRPTA